MILLGIYNYTVILTYLAMLISFAGMHFAFCDRYNAALLCLMVSGVFDMFDGKVASTKKDRTPSEKLFGIQIDSMCDLVCYGVFPALMVYHVGAGSHLITAVCAVYLLCAVIRLSWFNVDEAERQSQTADSRHEYRGLPVTSAALVMPAVFIACSFTHRDVPSPQSAAIAAVALVLMGACFISPFKLLKPSRIGRVLLIVVGLEELFLLLTGGSVHLGRQRHGIASPEHPAPIETNVDTFLGELDVSVP